jgi:drug/metabolite transporter (DMT)-like permease
MMVKYIIISSIAVLLTAIAQILLKVGANKNRGSQSLIKQYLNIYIFAGYCVFFGVTVINLYVYKFLPIKLAVVFLPFVFIFVAVFSFLVFNETLTKKQLISYIIIIIGVVIYNLS